MGATPFSPQELHDRAVREKFFHKVPSMPQESRVLLQHAYDEGFMRHAGQKRDDGKPYFEGHVVQVAYIALRFGYCRPLILAVCLLHDILEDSWMPLSKLERLFDHEIARMVTALSKSYGLEDPITGCATRTEKKPLPIYFEILVNMGDEVCLVKICDRLHNLSDLVDPDVNGRWTNNKRRAYIEETETYILPLALKLDPRMAEELKRLIAEIRANIRIRELEAAQASSTT